MNIEEKLQQIQATANSDPDAAVFKLRDLLKGNDDLLTGLYIQGSIHFLKQEYKEASVIFAQIINADPKHESASRYLFHSLWQRQDQVHALEEIKRFWQTFGADHKSDLAIEYRRIIQEIRQQEQ